MVKRLHWLVTQAMILAFILMIVASSLQIITRYVFRAPLLGAEELARLFGVWLYFLGTSAAILTREHISIDIVSLRVRPGLQRVFRVLADLLLGVFNAIVLVEGTKFALFSHNFESASLRFPMSLFAAALPLSAAFVLVFLAFSVWHELRDIPAQGR